MARIYQTGQIQAVLSTLSLTEVPFFSESQQSCFSIFLQEISTHLSPYTN